MAAAAAAGPVLSRASKWACNSSPSPRGSRIGTETDIGIFESGDIHSLGSGDAIEFHPVFWVDAAVPKANQVAGFRFVDLGNGSEVMDSGRFHFVFAPVPEPETDALFGIGILLSGIAVRRRR